jgi:hypothetical protein
MIILLKKGVFHGTSLASFEAFEFGIFGESSMFGVSCRKSLNSYNTYLDLLSIGLDRGRWCTFFMV